MASKSRQPPAAAATAVGSRSVRTSAKSKVRSEDNRADQIQAKYGLSLAEAVEANINVAGEHEYAFKDPGPLKWRIFEAAAKTNGQRWANKPAVQFSRIGLFDVHVRKPQVARAAAHSVAAPVRNRAGIRREGPGARTPGGFPPRQRPPCCSRPSPLAPPPSPSYSCCLYLPPFSPPFFLSLLVRLGHGTWLTSVEFQCQRILHACDQRASSADKLEGGRRGGGGGGEGNREGAVERSDALSRASSRPLPQRVLLSLVVPHDRAIRGPSRGLLRLDASGGSSALALEPPSNAPILQFLTAVLPSSS